MSSMLRSFVTVFQYSLELSKRSPRALWLYMISFSLERYGFSLGLILIYSQSKVFYILGAIVFLCTFISGRVSGTLKLMYDEEVRSGFIGSILRRIGNQRLEVLESPHMQELIAGIKEKFSLVKTVLDAPFILIPAFVALTIYLSLLADLSLPGFYAVLTFGLVSALGSYFLYRKTLYLERAVIPFRLEVASLPEMLLEPEHIAEVNMQGNIQWFAERLTGANHRVMLLERRIRRILFVKALLGLFTSIMLVSVYLFQTGFAEAILSFLNSFEPAELKNIEDVLDSQQVIAVGLTMFWSCDLIDELFQKITVFATSHTVVSEFLTMGSDVAFPPTETAGASDQAPVRVEAHKICLSRQDNQILNDISFLLENENLSVVGGNGSGKSTLIKILIGHYRPSRGRIRCNISQKHIAFMAQDPPIFPSLSIYENVLLGKQDTEYSRGFVKDFLWDNCNIETRCGSEYGGFNPSGGQKQMIAWARLFLRMSTENIKLVLLDEPTSALDGSMEKRLMKRLLRYNIPIVFITHKHQMAQIADKILILKDGSVAALCSPQQSLNEEEYQRLFL